MHDHRDPYSRYGHDRDPWADPPYGVYAEPGRDLDRLTHLVLVDGRLVDVWSERVTGSAWEPHARRFDAERRPPEPLPKPAHQRVLEWLDASCGGRPAVLALDDAPLRPGDHDADQDLAAVEEVTDRRRLEECVTALDLVAVRLFDAEVGLALRRALLLVWREDVPTVRGPRSADVLAGGVCWAVGRANGLFKPQGRVAMQEVKEMLDRPGTLSAHGHRVRQALHGFRGWSLDLRPPVGPGVPDLQPLGHVELLVGSVRGDLARLRDRALAAEAEDELHRAGWNGDHREGVPTWT